MIKVNRNLIVILSVFLDCCTSIDTAFLDCPLIGGDNNGSSVDVEADSNATNNNDGSIPVDAGDGTNGTTDNGANSDDNIFRTGDAADGRF